MSGRPRLAKLALLAQTLILVSLDADPACAQRLGLDATPDVAWWRIAGALAFCITLAVGVAFLAKVNLGVRLPFLAAFRRPSFLQSGVATSARRLSLVEIVRLSHQIDICLLDCDGATLIVAASAAGVVQLKLDAAYEIPGGRP